MTSNTTLADELEAVNSIYDAETLVITSADGSTTSTVLTLPNSPFSFSITFPHDYPDVPPQINGTQSTGPYTKKGEGDAALSVLRDVFGSTYTPGQVCLFDLIEEVSPLLHLPNQDSQAERTFEHHHHDDGPTQDLLDPSPHRSDTNTPPPHVTPQSDTPAPALTEPDWSLSQPILVSKSSFVARAVHVSSVGDATSAIAHLLSTNKKVAGATHNITAWRIRTRKVAGGPEVVVQDCDDDGETAAGGRVLHLLQVMDVWNVVVVVSRWYGGVKLGPDRFRCINMVARDALVRGGFVEEGESGKGKGKRK